MIIAYRCSSLIYPRFQAFQEQLGSKLESTKAPADVLVIEKLEIDFII